MRIKQVYIPYWDWEDWKAGMWRKLPANVEQEYMEMAIKFTGDWKTYGQSMMCVAMKWPCTMLNTLSNPSVNKRAFLGHCAVQYRINCPEYITRMAWRELTEQQRVAADEIAQLVIDYWNRYARKT